MSFYDTKELCSFGFKHLGKDIRISKKTSIYNPGNISIDDNSRIDDFCILSAGKEGIYIGKYVHIAPYVNLQGLGKIIVEDFSGLSSKVAIYSSTDDFSGAFLTGPTIPDKYRRVATANVIIKKHVIVGAGAVILPGVQIGEGVAVGALSLIRKDCQPFFLYAGVPAKRIKERKRDLLEKERAFLQKNI